MSCDRRKGKGPRAEGYGQSTGSVIKLISKRLQRLFTGIVLLTSGGQWSAVIKTGQNCGMFNKGILYHVGSKKDKRTKCVQLFALKLDAVFLQSDISS
ncbi:hypothetical protein RRG08_033109 [Elysia crispata]|uniref:Uncharacterized protein n=1 Tax=Elysia crispata TaxID=231223 RepID=A0AAE1EDA5_9GAST|nr:hypothetical protein RRG08_033109 [Elysia crispata]